MKDERPNWGVLLAILALGFYLRWHQLTIQILSDDEWHAVRTAVRDTYRQMATGFSISAVPLLSMLYKAIHDNFGASELSFRMPMLLSGLALILVFPWVLPPGTLSRRGLAALAALVAISPLLIYFSRYARPYAPSVLLSTAGVFAFYRWYCREPGRWGALYVFCVVLGPAFHLTSITTLAAPFAWAFYQRWRGRGERTYSELWRLGFLSGGLFLLAVGPPILLDFRAIEQRAGASRVVFGTFSESLPLLAGVAGWALWPVVAAAVLGFVLLARRAPQLASFLGFATVVTLFASAVSGADSVQVPIVFVRYSLWLAPFFLLMVAVALGALADRLPAPAAWPALAAALGLLFVAGPWLPAYGRVNSWTSHAIYQYAYSEDSPYSYERRPPYVPPLYRQLAKEPPGSLTIAEAPFYYEWHNNIFVYYQEIHQQRVVSGMLGVACDRSAINTLPSAGAKLELRNTVDVSHRRDLVKHGVDLVIFHKNAFQEMPRVFRNQARVPTTNLAPQTSVERCLPRYRKVLGKPFYEDEYLVAYDFRQAPPEVVDELLFFKDSFESGDLSAWSKVVQ
jgi:hypothetical protein